MDPSSQPAGPATVIDSRYEVLAELGRGGSSVVYLAADRALGGARVAVKVYLPSRAGGREAERFAREVGVGLSLNHPRVVKVHGFGAGDVGGSRAPYLVMEHAAGPSLHDLLAARGPLPAARAAAVLRQLAEALAHVHAQGVVHRDLKPANVLLAADGTARLADFGSALVPGSGEAAPAGGTYGFTAPEALAGIADPRSDVFSFGLVALLMRSGEPAPPADEPARRRAARRLRAPGWYRDLVDRCCRDDPALRVQTFDEVVAYLDRATRPRARLGRLCLRTLGSVAFFVAAAVPGTLGGVAVAARLGEPGRRAAAWLSYEADVRTGQRVQWLLHRVGNTRGLRWDLRTFVAADMTRAAELLLGLGADPNFIAPDGTQLLLAQAVVHRNARLVNRLLLADGFRSDAADANGRSVLTLACMSGLAEPEAVRRAIAAGAPLNHRDEPLGVTALHYAVATGREDLAHLLLDQPGIDPGARGRGGETPLMVAEGKGLRSVAARLRAMQRVTP